ncbi:hypothetical protein BJX64DRAFT_286898 [Aspergillus heterothallicus]
MSTTSSRSILGSLTTTFTYPSSCTVAIRQCETCNLGWQAQTCVDDSSINVADNSDCWPARTASPVQLGTGLGGLGFYSPGIYCPVGYETSCSATGSVDGGFPFQFPILQSETAIGCCPPGFSCTYDPGTGNAQTCLRMATTGSFAAAECSSGETNGFSYITVPESLTNTVSDSEEPVTFSTFTIVAPLFQLVFRSNDIPTSTNTASITSTATTPTSTGPVQTQSPSNEGLSTGAKAGIGVGVSLGVIALISAAFLYFLRRRTSPAATTIPAEEPKPELSGGQYQHAVELQAISTLAEMPSNSSLEHR